MTSFCKCVSNYVTCAPTKQKTCTNAYSAREGVYMKLGIVGYGNLGKGCEKFALADRDIQLVGIFTRRDASKVKSEYGTSVYDFADVFSFENKIDVLCVCVGSANDLQDVQKKLANRCCTVDSFDTHAKMTEYAYYMRKKVTDKLSYIAIGWDPGLFSLMRALFSSLTQSGSPQTFWGKGVSQGHGEAVRRIEGVENAVQYTIPKESAINAVRNGFCGELIERDKHKRECFVVAKEGADKELIEKTIKNMPYYFAQYDTDVHFISQKEMEREHSAMPHGGFVLQNGFFNGKNCNLEFCLKLQSNPDFTAGVLVSYAKACARAYQRGERGVKTVLDVPVSDLLEGEWIDNVKRFI